MDKRPPICPKPLQRRDQNIPNNFRRLLESPTIGVKKEKPKSPTRPVEFNFKTAARALVRNNSENGIDRKSPDDMASGFKALPLPSNPTKFSLLPPKIPRPSTKPMPFNLKTDSIHAKETEKLKKLKADEERKRREMAQFHTEGMPDFKHMKVFCPKLGQRQYTEPENVQLNLEKRSMERKKFDDRMKALEEYKADVLRQREVRHQMKEEEEWKKLREETAFRAQPIKHYKPIEIKFDPNQITIPISPVFSTDMRLASRPPSRNGTN